MSQTPSLENATFSSKPPKLLDQVVERLRVKHYSKRTEQAYVHWIKHYIFSHGKRHPRAMGAGEVETFLSMLATQNQALAAILVLYREVLGVDLPWLNNVTRAKRPARLPTVLSAVEMQALLRRVEGTSGLVIRLLYGAGMRLMEGLRLRVKDMDLVVAHKRVSA